MDLFDRLLKLFSDHTKWTKGHFARNAEGQACSARDPKACCWCLSGAIWEVTIAEFDCVEEERAIQAINKAISLRGFNHTARFNDDDNTRFEDVVQVIREGKNIFYGLPVNTPPLPPWTASDTIMLFTILVMATTLVGAVVWSFLP